MLQKDGVAPYKFLACLLHAHCSVMPRCNNVLLMVETDKKAQIKICTLVRGAVFSILLLLENLTQKIYDKIPKKSSSYTKFQHK
jgi:hypothetical protein